jgi:hypothetical protein
MNVTYHCNRRECRYCYSMCKIKQLNNLLVWHNKVTFTKLTAIEDGNRAIWTKFCTYILHVEIPLHIHICTAVCLKYTNYIQQNPTSEANSHSANQEIPCLMVPRDSLLCSQEPTTGPYPGPHETNPLPSSLRFIQILSSHLCLGLHSSLSLHYTHEFNKFY